MPNFFRAGFPEQVLNYNVMKKCIFPCLVLVLALLSHPVYSQSKQDTASLGMAGDNLDLYAVVDLFLKSKTIEAFEKSLNEQKTGINNLDLDLDGKIDFIKVVTKKDGDAYTFVLQDAVSKTETQDVAVILVNKGKDGKISVQAVGDEDLYGKDYVIEPRTSASPSVTANPAYQGSDPVTKDVPASTTTVVVQQAPIVQYVYSPAYVPYYPPYYYGFYPPYFAMAATIAVGIYRHNNWYHHGGYYGGHYHGGGNTVVINNRNQINHYNNTRNTSNRVQNNMANGNYGNGNRGNAGNRPSTGGPSGSTRPSNGAAGSNRPSASTRPAEGGSNRASNGPSASTRETGFSNGNRGSSSSMNQGRTRSSGSSSGGYSGGGGNRSSGGFSGGGGSRGGGGGRRR
jgi:hypothetical protein